MTIDSLPYLFCVFKACLLYTGFANQAYFDKKNNIETLNSCSPFKINTITKNINFFKW